MHKIVVILYAWLSASFMKKTFDAYFSSGLSSLTAYVFQYDEGSHTETQIYEMPII